MIDHVMKRWGGHMNSFYTELYSRIQDIKDKELPEEWNGVIKR